MTMTDERDDERDHPLTRRTFIGASVAGAIAVKHGRFASRADATPPPQTPSFALEELTIDELQSRMRSGSESSA